jgi:hypothetical protein
MRARVNEPVRRLGLEGGRGEFVLLAVLVAAFGVLIGTFSSTVVPPSSLVLPIVLGVLVLRLSQLIALLVLTAITAAVTTAVVGFTTARVGVLVILALVGAVSYYTVHVRERLGIVGTRGDTMLGELKDRLLAAPNLASLPATWRFELASRTAGGSAFGGDFVVSWSDARRWELALVDVSGKGVAAGSRALQLSGALGGLIGSVSAADFLAKSNGYLLRQQWREGFATAAHLSLDVRTGAYALRSAGHPPMARFQASNGEWTLAEAEGPALGLLEDAAYEPVTGTLRPGDALLLYTDGLVEIPGRDLGVGIDKLLGEANRLVLRGFTGGAERLIDAVSPGGTDDRAALLLWRV